MLVLPESNRLANCFGARWQSVFLSAALPLAASDDPASMPSECHSDLHRGSEPTTWEPTVIANPSLPTLTGSRERESCLNMPTLRFPLPFRRTLPSYGANIRLRTACGTMGRPFQLQRLCWLNVCGKNFTPPVFVGAFVLDRRFGLARGFENYWGDFPQFRYQGKDPGMIQIRGDRVEAAAEEWITANRRNDSSLLFTSTTCMVLIFCPSPG